MILDRPEGQNMIVKLFVVIPFLAVLTAAPLVWGWGWGLSWVDVGLAVFFYFLGLAA